MASTITRTRRDFLVIGHRGSPKRARENTVESLRTALADGADGFETDLRRTADGVIVLHHDSEVDDRPVAAMPFSALRDQKPDVATLSDLETISGAGRMVLEIKEPGFESELIAAVDGWEGVVLCSFDHDIVDRLSGRGRFECGLTVRDYRPDLVDRCRAIGAQWFFPKWNHVDQSLVTLFRREGVAVVPWTANRQSQWARLFSWGCAGVITDAPLAADRWRSA